MFGKNDIALLILPYNKGSVISPVDIGIPLVAEESSLVNDSVEKQISGFCMSARNILEIADHLGYKDKKTVRSIRKTDGDGMSGKIHPYRFLSLLSLLSLFGEDDKSDRSDRG